MRNAKAYIALLEKAVELGILKRYHDDLTKTDKRILENTKNNELFFWYIREWGTHLYSVSELVNLSTCQALSKLQNKEVFNDKEGYLFLWDGKELIEVKEHFLDFLKINYPNIFKKMGEK